ncbi:MAG: beta-propeller fold lactonase family protein [Planctomycetaceae bacterium]|nr:beta-propeller fold lactonase family protein [Planctomycetaceae bacterium]
MRSDRSLSAIFLSAIFLLPAFADEPDRSPVDLLLGPNDAWLAAVNQTADTISLVRTADGKVLDEEPVGDHPSGIALAPDGKTLLVSCHYSGEVVLLEVQGEKLARTAAIDVGFQPHGIAVAPRGKTAYVATTANAQVAVLDLDQRQVTARIDVGRWPRHMALSPDGSRLAVGTSGDRGLTVVDTKERKELYREQFVGLNIGHLAASKDGQYVYFPWMVYRNNPISPGNIRLGWVLASRIARLRLDGPARREAMSLDPQGKAIADVHGLALTSDESRLIVSASGTHELLVYRTEGLPLKDFGGSDHIDPELLKDADRFHRIELGGRPMGLRIGKDDKTVYVANYLDNSVQVVDLADRKVARTIPLGGPEEPSLARKGEAIFLDARRSLDQWYSCHTCHYDGGTNSVPTDTTNDGTAFTFKTVLDLHHLSETGPWTWHGWQTDLRSGMRKSLTETMLGPQPTEDDVDAILAYFQTLTSPPNPFRNKDGSLTDAAQRGKTIFESDRAGCASCHTGPHFTDGEVHDVGLGSRSDRYKGFNTPTLRNVYQRVKLLHDARVDTLEALLTGPHAPEKVAGTGGLSEREVKDLVEYLKSL